MFGDYLEVHKENPITNSMSPRTRSAILWAHQETYRDVRIIYSLILMPESVIENEKKRAERDRAKNGIKFRNKKNYDWENKVFDVEGDEVCCRIPRSRVRERRYKTISQ